MDCCCISVRTKAPGFVLLFLVTKTIFTQDLHVLVYCMGLSLLFAQGFDWHRLVKLGVN